MNEPKHSPLPWHWGDDYAANEPLEEMKYADFQLYAAGGSEVIPIRFDHYQPLWDTAAEGTVAGLLPSKADRDFIVRAVNSYDALLAVAKCVAKQPCVHAIATAAETQCVVCDAKAAIAKSEEPNQ